MIASLARVHPFPPARPCGPCALVAGGRRAGARGPPVLPLLRRRAAAVRPPVQLLPRRAADPGAPRPVALRLDQRRLAPVAGALDDRAALLPVRGRRTGR